MNNYMLTDEEITHTLAYQFGRYKKRTGAQIAHAISKAQAIKLLKYLIANPEFAPMESILESMLKKIKEATNEA